MATLKLYYVTNRKHEGAEQFAPTRYSGEFSASHQENLRFGKVSIDVDTTAVLRWLEKENAGKLEKYLREQVEKTQKIEAFQEILLKTEPDTQQPKAKLGSQAMFAEIRQAMLEKTDILVFVHGYSVSWEDAVSSALTLQEMLNRKRKNPPNSDKVLVILFSWPSDGQKIPIYSYLSDKHDSESSGNAVARGMLKLRDYLLNLQIAALNDPKNPDKRLCKQEIHLLCHSMGNYLLQFALAHLYKFTPQNTYPQLFKHIFLCASDVDDDALEPGKPLGDLHQIADSVTVYYNRGDIAMPISQFTKLNHNRLGRNGAGRPRMLHQKVHQVDCSDVVTGAVEHSYYLEKKANDDIYLSLHATPQEDRKNRSALAEPRTWKLV